MNHDGCTYYHGECASDDWETPCPKRDDGQHCNCWYDGDPCCACGDKGKREEG